MEHPLVDNTPSLKAFQAEVSVVTIATDATGDADVKDSEGGNTFSKGITGNRAAIHKVDMGRKGCCRCARQYRLVMDSEKPPIVEEAINGNGTQVGVPEEKWDELVYHVNKVLKEKFDQEVLMRQTHTSGIFRSLLVLILLLAFVGYVYVAIPEYPGSSSVTTVFGGTIVITILSILHCCYSLSQDDESETAKQGMQQYLEEFVGFAYPEIGSAELVIEEPTPENNLKETEWYIAFSQSGAQDEDGEVLPPNFNSRSRPSLAPSGSRASRLSRVSSAASSLSRQSGVAPSPVMGSLSSGPSPSRGRAGSDGSALRLSPSLPRG